MRVFVTTGTDVHPFDRLVRWADDWARTHPEDEVVVQYGRSAPPAAAPGHGLLEREAMRSEIRAADLIVASCGPGAVMDIRAAGRLPVVVARRVALGEHVDDHQTAFAKHLVSAGLARVVEDEAGFVEILREVRESPEAFRVDPAKAVAVGVLRIGELIDRLMERGPD